MSQREQLLAEARHYIGTVEDPKGSNRALRIDYWLHEVGSPLGSAWCAASLHGIGVQAVGRSRWPFKRSGLVQDTVNDAKTRGLFHATLNGAQPGDLLVLYYPALKRFGHIAIIEEISAGKVTSLDGNTAPEAADGSPADREGYVYGRRRRVRSDRMAYIAWPADTP